jgi:hypothetical protein
VTFPDGPLCSVVEIFYDSAWHDISVDVDGREDIVIRHGRADEAAVSDPSLCTLTLKNPDGKYSPRNPLSPLSGKIGRNTPLRVRVGDPDVALVLPGIQDARAVTPDSAALDITGDLDVRIEVAPDTWRPTGPMVLAAKFDTNDSGRSWAVLITSDGEPQLLWSTDGTIAGRQFRRSTVPIPEGTGGLALRWTLDVNDAGSHTVRFYTAVSISGPWTQLGAAVTQSGTTAILSGNAELEVGTANDGGVPVGDGVRLVGRVRALEVRSGIGGTVVAEADFTALQAGDVAFVDSAGRAWSVAGLAYIGDWSVRFSGEVSAWPPRWESELDVTTPIEASGISRRLGQGSSPLQSALRRGMLSDAITPPVAYWPCEDGADASRFASAFAGHPPLTRNSSGGVTPADWDDAPATTAIPTYTSGSTRGTVPAYTATNHLRLMVFASFPDTLDTGEHLVMEARTSGTSRLWRLWINQLGQLIIRAYDLDNTQILDSGAGTALLGRSGLLWIYLTQSGANIAWQIGHADADSGQTGVVDATLTARTFGRAIGVGVGPGNLQGTAVGHVVVLATAEFWSAETFAQAWTGEAAIDRMARLAEEEAVPVTVRADGDVGELVGPQRPRRYLDLVREAAAVDLGVLSDRRDALGLHYRARSTLYNQAPALVLDYDAGQAYAPLHPEDDDQATRNDVTVERDGGSSYRAVREDGPLSIQPPPAGVGRYDDSVRLSLHTDTQPQDQAGWRLHLGTIDEPRYPKVRLNLHRSPELIDAAKRLELGDRIAITNPPQWLPPGAIDLIVQGYTETINSVTWDITWTCTPGSAWTVGVMDDDRADTAGCELDADVDADDTELSVQTTAGPRWTTDPTEFPFDVLLGGEVVTVTAISGTTTSQTMTVTRSVNGISTSHDAGTAVALAQPAIVAL